MKHASSRRGFTLIEMIIVVIIMALLGLMTIAILPSKKNSNDLKLTVSGAGALLREAQSRSMSDYGGVPWGVYFKNATNTAPFYALFSSSYSATTTQGYYRLPPDVAYATATIATGSSVTVLFNAVSGVSASTTIGFVSLSQKSLASGTISISPIGTVTY